jgi:hypothetical protein
MAQPAVARRRKASSDEANIPVDDPRRKLLPTPRAKEIPASASALSPQRVRRLATRAVYFLVYLVVQALFSVYIRARRAYHAVAYAANATLYHHHRSPEYIARDAAGLSKRPRHLSVVLTLGDETRLGPELERLVDEAAELAAWSASAGIPVLSVYERTGILKKYLPQVHQHVVQKFTTYFGRNHPGLTVTAPDQDSIETLGPLGRRAADAAGDDHDHDSDHDSVDAPPSFARHMQLTFISSADGRDALVDLTRTFAEMRQHGKIRPDQIQPDVIDTELVEGIVSEPDLLVIFGPHIKLDGYPPWQLRLTEIYCLQDNEGVGYQVFLRALQNFARAEMRKGR